VLNVVNFGGGSYVVYAEVQGDTIEVDPEPYGDNFARPARLLPLQAKALVAAIDVAALPQDALVLELVYGVETPLLAAARARGLTVQDGTRMLLHQGARAFELWTAQPAPLEVVGVVRDSKYMAVFEGSLPHFYVPLRSERLARRSVLVRSTMPPDAVSTSMRAQIAALDPEMPVSDIAPLARTIAGNVGFLLFRVGALEAESVHLFDELVRILADALLGPGAPHRDYVRDLGVGETPRLEADDPIALAAVLPVRLNDRVASRRRDARHLEQPLGLVLDDLPDALGAELLDERPRARRPEVRQA